MSARPFCRSCKVNRHQGEPHIPGCDRVLVLAAGGAGCPCGARLEWDGDLDADGQEWLDDWCNQHADCEVAS